MGNEKILRPDVKNMMAAASRIDSKLQEVSGSADAYRRAAQDAAQQLYDDRLRKELEKMDVDHINNAKQGIRTPLLRDAGIQNVWQASQLSFRQICDIDGLGEQSAQKIRDTVQQICENTKSTLRVRLQIDNPTAADDLLIRALYQLIHFRPLREQAKELYQKHHTPLQQELALCKKAANGFGWLFQSKARKQQIAQAADALQERLLGEFGNGVLLDAWTAIEQVSLEACWTDYRQDASAYYAQLEQ